MVHHMNRCLSILVFLSALPCVGRDAAGEERIQYGRDVRPILARYCLGCHGPDEAARKADLRLDVRDDATRTLPNGQRAITPRDPEHSEMLNRLLSADPEITMPPPEFGKKPTEKELRVLQAWISQSSESRSCSA